MHRGEKTRESLTSGLPSRQELIPHFAYHSLIFLSIHYYEHNPGLAGHLVAEDPLLQDRRLSEMKIWHTKSFLKV